jgi:UDP-N-acetylglucosamine--dolichyl-phosphate N-acetylglucosaminephosphotransferase
MMMFIPFPFSHMFHTSSSLSIGRETFPQGEVCYFELLARLLTFQLTLYMTSLLSLLTATLLGFIDDLFDIRWRHKLPIPLIAAIPTLMVYYSEGGWTWVVLPASLGKLLSTLGLPGWEGTKSVDLGTCSCCMYT